MNQLMECMTARRTIRRYKKEQINEEEINEILQAGLYAPSAGGRQGVIFLVIQNSEVNERLGKINKANFQGLVNKASYISKEQPSIADDTSIISAFYGAPTIVTLFAPKNFPNSTADCSVAAENMMLAAYSLGIGSCMVARADETFSSDYGQSILKKSDIDQEYMAYCHVLLGYPDCEWPTAKPRKEGRIIRMN